MKINISGLKGILADYRTYAEQKDRAYAKLQQQIAEAKEVYNAEALDKFIAEKSGAHEKEYQMKFSEMAAKLNRELDGLTSSIKSQIEAARPADYEAKLANSLAIIGILDSGTISKNAEFLVAHTWPFSYDPLAKAAIEKALFAKNILAGDLFDYETPQMLENIGKSRQYADHYWDGMDTFMTMSFERNFGISESKE